MIGVGNRWRGDDAAGLVVAARAGGRECEGDCSRLIDMWGPDDDVLVVDAASSGAAAGTVHRLDATSEPLPAAVLASSTHAVGVPEAVELARSLGRMPRRLRVWAIEGVSFEAGDELSPPVAAAINGVAVDLAALRGARGDQQGGRAAEHERADPEPDDPRA